MAAYHVWQMSWVVDRGSFMDRGQVLLDVDPFWSWGPDEYPTMYSTYFVCLCISHIAVDKNHRYERERDDLVTLCSWIEQSTAKSYPEKEKGEGELLSVKLCSV